MNNTGVNREGEYNSRDEFRRQWVIMRVASTFDQDWLSKSLGEHHVLYYHPDLTVRDVMSCGVSLRKILILGVALFADAPDEDVAEAFQRKLAAAGGRLPSVVTELSGTYVVIESTARATNIYTDPAGMRGVYYKDGEAASTPALLKDTIRDLDLDAQFPFGRPDDWYPGDLCPYKGVRALMANHCLNLQTGETERFWPTVSPTPIGTAEAVARISKIMVAMVRAASNRWSVICSITGGKDSRVSLAASKDYRDRIRYFTLLSASTHRCDRELPRDLAGRHGLNHVFVHVDSYSKHLRRSYDTITAGMAGGTRRDILTGCATLQGRAVLHLNGNLGAITKRFYWPTPNPRTAKPNVLIREFANRPPQIVEAVARWFNSVPIMEARAVYNLMYLEQRGGRWMGIGETGSHLFYDSTSLFCNRQVFELATGAMMADQNQASLLTDLVREMWPELLEVPYCTNRRSWSKRLPMWLRSWLKATLSKSR